ncbi:MAG: hypothetical protein JWO11_3103 [Nocardioides sp.]|nr:hypothetical protein [Nocardioides sp.]
MIPVSAPPRVGQRLRNAPDGPVPVVHRGRHALYVDLGGRCVGVVAATATAVPCALRIAGPELPFAGHRAEVRDGVLRVDGSALVPGRYVDVTVPRLGSVPAPSGSSTRLDPDTVARMVGSGDGLTPYADDVLCGWLAIHRAAGVATPEIDAAVRSHLSRTTLLSATLLACALWGEVLPEFAAWVAAVGTAAEPARATALAAVGHTSGAGLLEGGQWALAGLSQREDAA